MPSLLLVKTSSLGDVIHALPVLSDLARARPDWKVHWVVEEAFACLPGLHPFTHKIVPVALRRWRRAPWRAEHRREWAALRARLDALQPDRVLDLQGLLKSALLCRLAGGEHHGYDWQSAREPLASLFYDVRHRVPREQHAVVRNRSLAALAMDCDASAPCDYGIHDSCVTARAAEPGAAPLAVLLHGTSREDKLWPQTHWVRLGQTLAQRGLQCLLPAGNAGEAQRAAILAEHIPGARCLPPGPLAAVLPVLASARLAVGVDTGLTHLATAFGLPTVAVFTATDPAATGVFGSAAAVNLGGIGRCPMPAEVLGELERLGAC